MDHQIIRESIAAFIHSGKFRNINFGDEYAAIVQSLGKPECVHQRSRKDKRPSIIKYGIVEFYFVPSIRGQTLVGILFQPLLHPCPSNKMKLDAGAFGEPMNANELEKYLDYNRIEYSWNKDTLDQRTIKTKSEVVFHFVEEKDELVLLKFGKFNY